MSTINTPISYTNKDFPSIYEELLNLGKELSYKWDPTVTNESDPGIVLIKEKALVADKNNYNIDKNILENYPETVTQDKMARQLFEQLGYKMPWYKAATGELTVKWKGDDLSINQEVKLPKFTMFTDDENTLVYTITEPLQINWTTKKFTTTVPVIQGTAINFTVAGNPTITTSNIDLNNRLYLDDYKIAQNGIFITSVDNENIEWNIVDNILTYPKGSYIYEFNIDPTNNLCYLQFPDDFDDLIGSGLNITYILTDGADGNVKAKTITNLFEDTSITIGNESVKLDDSNIVLSNLNAITNGKDPENIEEAYQSYKRIVGTFDTLVTLRDYENAVYNSGLVSNVKVSDKYHDIQTTYSILTDESGIVKNEIKTKFVGTNSCVSYMKLNTEEIPTFVENKYYEYNKDNKQMSLLYSKPTDWDTNYNDYYVLYNEEQEDLTAYDLRLYLLQSAGKVKNIKSYNDFKNVKSYDDTFELIPPNNAVMTDVKEYIYEKECIQHNYKDILKDIPCLYRNVYPLNIKVVPQYKLNETQQADVMLNILNALRTALNSKNIEFGEEPDYDNIYNIIMNSDSRIKVIILDDFNYTTYASYWDGEQFKHVPISDFRNENINKDKSIIVADTKIELENIINNKKEIFTTDKSNYLYIATKEDNHCYTYSKEENRLKPYSDKIQEFRKDVITKSVLAGKTSLFNVDDKFTYLANQAEEKSFEDVEKISTNLVVSPFDKDTTSIPSETTTENISGDPIPVSIKPQSSLNVNQGEYTLDKNESIQIYAPAFKTSKSFSNYVKLLLILNNPTGYEYKLKKLSAEEVISNNNPVYVYNDEYNKYDKYTEDSIVKGYDGTYNKISIHVANDNLNVYSNEPIYTINEDQEYRLKEGDYIYFFYKTADEDNSPYVYERYTGIDSSKVTDEIKSPIIKSNFTINGKSKNDTIATKFISNFTNAKGEIEYNDGKNSPYQIVLNFYGDNDLSGTKEIDIREINQAVFNPADQEKYYFITNNIKKDGSTENYVLTLPYQENLSSEGNNVYEYILKNDEYFLYVDKNNNTYETAGSGTLIRIIDNINKNPLPEIVQEVNKVDIVDISNEGLNAFLDNCISIDYKVLVREQQIFNFTEGDTLHFELTPEFYNTENIETSLKTTESSFIPVLKIESNDLDINRSYDINSLNVYLKQEEDKIPIKFTSTITEDKKTLKIYPEFVVDTFTKITASDSFSEDKYCTVSNDLIKYNVVNYTPNTYYTLINDNNIISGSSQFFKKDIDELYNGSVKHYDIDSKLHNLPKSRYSPAYEAEQYYQKTIKKVEFTEIYKPIFAASGSFIYYIRKIGTEVNTDPDTGKIYITDINKLILLEEEPADWGPEGEFYTYIEATNRYEKVDFSIFEYEPAWESGKYYPNENCKESEILNAQPSNWGTGDYYYIEYIPITTPTTPESWGTKETWYYDKEGKREVTFNDICAPKNDIPSYYSENMFYVNGDLILNTEEYKYLQIVPRASTNVYGIINEVPNNNAFAKEHTDKFTYYENYKCIKNSDIEEVVNFEENLYYKYDNGKYTLITSAPEEKTEGWKVKYTVLTNEEDFQSNKDKNNIYKITSKSGITYIANINKYIDTNCPIFNSNEAVSLKGCNIRYTLSAENNTENNETELPKIVIGDNDSTWKVRTSLNANSDSITPQIIKSASNSEIANKHHIQLYYINQDKSYLITSNKDDILLYSELPVQTLGGQNVDITYVDFEGNKKTINMLLSKNINITDKDINGKPVDFILDSDNNINLKLIESPIDTEDNSKHKPSIFINDLKLDTNYYYILPVRNQSSKVTYSLNVSNKRTDIYSISSFETDYGKGMQYYVFYPSTDIYMKNNLQITINGTDKDNNLIIYPLVKFQEITAFEDNYNIKISDIIDNMKELDPNNSFKYNYIIPKSDLIEDPLKANTFFNENHVCNGFTIAKADLSIGSSVDIINNR